MKTADAVAGSKPQPRQTEPGRIRYEIIPGGATPKEPSREQTRSRLIGRNWRSRLQNANP